MSNDHPNSEPPEPLISGTIEVPAELAEAPPMTESDYRERLEKGFQMRGLDIPEITDAQVVAFMADGLTPPEAFDTLTA